MKISKEQMAEHRDRIIAAAAVRFRADGFDGVTVAELMKGAGLTHGGFYNHFESKEELMALAVRRAFDETALRWKGLVKRNPSDPIGAILASYLSGHHLEHPESGCVVAALGTETARQSVRVKAAMANGIEQLLRILESSSKSGSIEQRRKKAITSLSEMVGAMMLARSQNDGLLARAVLHTASDSILKVSTRKRAMG